MKLTVIPATQVTGAAVLNLWAECNDGRSKLHITVNGADIIDFADVITDKFTPNAPLPSPIPVDYMPLSTLANLIWSMNGLT